MCKKTLDNEDLENSNENNQEFSLNANTDFNRIFKLIEDKIKPLSLTKDWELFLYFNIKEKLEKDETKENTKELKVLDSELTKEIEENDKYSIYEKYINANTELLKQQNKNKSLVDNIEELKEQVKFNEKNYDDLYNTNNELITKIKKKKAYINELNRELIDTKKSFIVLQNKYTDLNNEISFMKEKNKELEHLLYRKDDEIAQLKNANRKEFKIEENYEHYQNYDYSNNNNCNNKMVNNNNNEYYSNSMQNNEDIPKPQNEFSNLFMLAEQTIRMENDYSNSDLKLPPMKEENQSSLVARENNDIKDGRRSSINSMAVFTPPTSPINRSNNLMIPSGQQMNNSLSPSKMNNYNSSTMNNNYNDNVNSNDNNGNISTRPRGRPSHKENNINENSKRLKPIAVNPNISLSSSSSSHILPRISSNNVPRMLNNNNSSQNYIYSDINDNNVLPALNRSHSQENIELPSLPLDIQRSNSMDGYKPSYNGKGGKNISMNDSQDYSLSSRIKNENNDIDRNDLMRNGNNDILMNSIPQHKSKDSYTFQQQSSYTPGKISRKNSQSGNVPNQPQQIKKQKYYQQLQPQTQNHKGGNGKHSNGSSSLQNTPISSPSSTTSSSTQNNTPREIKHVSPSAYVRWKTSEDDLLRALVKKMGPKQWDKIAEEIPGRTYHQCRQRWVNTLSKKFPEDRNAKNKNSNQLHHHNSSSISLAPTTSRYNNSFKHGSLDENELSYNNEKDLEYPIKQHSLGSFNSKNKFKNNQTNDYLNSNNDYYSSEMNNINMNNQNYNNNNNNKMNYNSNNLNNNNTNNNNNNNNNLNNILPRIDNLTSKLSLTNSPSLAPMNLNKNNIDTNKLPSINSFSQDNNLNLSYNNNNNNNNNYNNNYNNNNNTSNDTYLNPINFNSNNNNVENNNVENNNYNNIINKNIINNNNNNNNNMKRNSLNDLIHSQDVDYKSIPISNSNKKNDTPVVMDEDTTISSGSTLKSVHNMLNMPSSNDSNNEERSDGRYSSNYMYNKNNTIQTNDKMNSNGLSSNSEHPSNYYKYKNNKNDELNKTDISKNNIEEDEVEEEIMVEGNVNKISGNDIDSQNNRKILNNINITQSPKSQKSEDDEEEGEITEYGNNYSSKSKFYKKSENIKNRISDNNYDEDRINNNTNDNNNSKNNNNNNNNNYNYNCKPSDERNDIDGYNLNRGMKRKRVYNMNGSLNKKIHSTIEQNTIEMPLTPQSISSENSGSGSIYDNNKNNFEIYSRKSETSSANSSPTTLVGGISESDQNLNKGIKGIENIDLPPPAHGFSKISSSNNEKNYYLPSINSKYSETQIKGSSLKSSESN